MAKRKMMDKPRHSEMDDAPEITPEFFATMRPAAEVDPEIIAAAKRARGRPRVAAPKQVIAVRMSAVAAAAFRALSTEKRAALVGGLEAKALQLYDARKTRTKIGAALHGFAEADSSRRLNAAKSKTRTSHPGRAKH